MLDDLFSEMLGEFAIGRSGQSPRAQRIVRLIVGGFGTALCAFGACYFAWKPGLTENVVLRTSMAAVFVFLSCFALFNVALARRWRWPLRLFVISFVLLFLARILGGR